MAKEAQQKSKRPEVQKLAADMIKAQDKELNHMKPHETVAENLVSPIECRADRLQRPDEALYADVTRPAGRHDDEPEFGHRR